MFACVFLVHPSGFEPETVRVGGENSIQLNYGCISTLLSYHIYYTM